MIELCRRQLSFGDGLIAEEVADLWEDWMRHVDAVLEDPCLLEVAYQALAGRWKNSRTLGRKGTPVDVVVRLLVLKHVRNWSYAALEREVRSNLVYRQFIVYLAQPFFPIVGLVGLVTNLVEYVLKTLYFLTC